MRFNFSTALISYLLWATGPRIGKSHSKCQLTQPMQGLLKNMILINSDVSLRLPLNSSPESPSAKLLQFSHWILSQDFPSWICNRHPLNHLFELTYRLKDRISNKNRDTENPWEPLLRQNSELLLFMNSVHCTFKYHILHQVLYLPPAHHRDDWQRH